MSPLRRPGGRWRLLVHEWEGRQPGMREGMYNRSITVQPDERRKPRGFTDDMWRRVQELETEGVTQHIALPGTEFDELVVGHWLHIEELDVGHWWMNIGGVTVFVDADRDGRPQHVTVFAPGDYDMPVEGCTYRMPGDET